MAGAVTVASFIFLLLLLSVPLESLTRAVPPSPAPAPAPHASAPKLAYGPMPGRPGWGHLGAVLLPKPLMRACVQTPFPEECAHALSVRVDPKVAADLRRLTEVSTRVAIEAGTALASFGYVHIGGAKNGTKLRQCVRDCTVRVDAAVKSLNASSAAMKRGDRAEAMQLLSGATNGFGACWGSCAHFTGEAMHVMQKRAHELEKLIRIASAILKLLMIGAIIL